MLKLHDTAPCMKGNIETSEKCKLCGGPLRYKPNSSFFVCSMHADLRVIPAGVRVRFGRDVQKRFTSLAAAERFLNGLRFEVDKGSFDKRDYQKINPLSFANQAQKWLTTKKNVSHKQYTNLNHFIDVAIDAWGSANVKAIGYSQIEDLLLSLTVSDKTRAEYANCYRQFFRWLELREGIQSPRIPKIDFTLGSRQIIDISTQQSIIAEIERICPNPRIAICAQWLATYIAIRPGEMRSLREQQIDVNGMFVLPPTSTKEKKLKIIPMLPEDIALYQSLPRGLPNMYFFRRIDTGEQIGKKSVYKWWKKACRNLGIAGVDLYGGTRHSSASAMTEFFSRDEIRDHATRHGSNKAFDRYCQGEFRPSMSIYAKLRENARGKNGKVIPLNRGAK